MKEDYEIIEFKNLTEWREWLSENHSAIDGVWLRLYKKGIGIESVSHAGALDQALCFGWIDGLRKGYDDQSFLQKFTPRRRNSLWSKRNIEHIERLTRSGLMMEAGLAEVERAKEDGRWQKAYDSFRSMTVPEDLSLELEKRPRAKVFFESLNKTNKYAVLWRLQTAKTIATRQRRLDKVLSMLEAGEKFH